MKITFIHPYYFNIWEPLGIGYIASYIQNNFQGKLELNFYQSYFDADESVIDGAAKSDIVAFSCTTPTYSHAIELAKKIKNKNKKSHIVFGGYHVTAMYKLIDDEVIDQMIVGEGEKAFLELLNGNRDRIVFSKSLGFEELFWPDRDLIMNYRTVDLCEQMIGKRITSFQANRVCPFRCTFCSERVMTGNFHRKNNPIRTRDVRDLMDEIEYVIAKYKLDFFKFADATFDTSTEFVINFCEEKIRRGNNIEWECLIHAGLAEKEMFTSLKHSNCNQVDVGCESGSKKVLREMRKGTTPDQTAKVFEWAREVGIKRRAFFLIGMPSETEEDIELTEKFIEKINPDVLGVTILCPYPGSDLYNHNLMKDVNWSEADEYSNDFWRTDHFTNNDLKNIQKRLTTKFKSKLAWHHNQIDNS